MEIHETRATVKTLLTLFNRWEEGEESWMVTKEGCVLHAFDVYF